MLSPELQAHKPPAAKGAFHMQTRPARSDPSLVPFFAVLQLQEEAL